MPWDPTKTALLPAPFLVRTIREQTGPLGSLCGGEVCSRSDDKKVRHLQRSSLTYRNLPSGGRHRLLFAPQNPNPIPHLGSKPPPQKVWRPRRSPRRGRFGIVKRVLKMRTAPPKSVAAHSRWSEPLQGALKIGAAPAAPRNRPGPFEASSESAIQSTAASEGCP